MNGFLPEKLPLFLSIGLLLSLPAYGAVQGNFWTAFERRTSHGMESALEIVNMEIDKNPQNGDAWAMKALIYGNAVDFMAESPAIARSSAEGALERALDYAPESPVTHAAYGLVRRLADPVGAESRLRQCTASRPEFAECHNLLGDLLRKTSRPEQAGDVYLEGLDRWPDNGELHVSYALYLQETGRPQDAIAHLRKLVADQPGFPRAHWHLATTLYVEGGNLDEAREHAVRALKMDPKIWNGKKLLKLLEPAE